MEFEIFPVKSTRNSYAKDFKIFGNIRKSEWSQRSLLLGGLSTVDTVADHALQEKPFSRCLPRLRLLKAPKIVGQ